MTIENNITPRGRERSISSECVEATLEDMIPPMRKSYLQYNGTPTSRRLLDELFNFLNDKNPKQLEKVRFIQRRM